MTLDPDALRRHADLLVADRLQRAETRLRGLAPERRKAIEQVAHAVGSGVAECLLEEAKLNEALAAALADIYRSEP